MRGGINFLKNLGAFPFYKDLLNETTFSQIQLRQVLFIEVLSFLFLFQISWIFQSLAKHQTKNHSCSLVQADIKKCSVFHTVLAKVECVNKKEIK